MSVLWVGTNPFPSSGNVSSARQANTSMPEQLNLAKIVPQDYSAVVAAQQHYALECALLDASPLTVLVVVTVLPASLATVVVFVLRAQQDDLELAHVW